MTSYPELISDRIDVRDCVEHISDLYYMRGWTDGLPIIPPTEARVAKMLSGTREKAQDIIGEIPPRLAEATVEKIAVNAVMAGCLPTYMPVIVTAVEAMLEKQVKLEGIQTTTHPSAPLIIVNGPIRNKIGLNSKHNLFGPGNRANAAIGRAIRLILLNIGGAIPGQVDKATHGQPCKYSFCIAENEEESPWEPLHVERGFDHSESTVTVMGCENPHNVNDHVGMDATSILTTVAGTMVAQGNNNILLQHGEPMVVLGPEHAETIADSGFTKQDVKHFLFKQARIPKQQFSGAHQEQNFPDLADDELISVTHGENAIIVLVAGGSGKHSLFLPTYALTASASRKIEA